MRQHNLLSSERPYAFVTCGHWDLATMLPAQLAMSTRLDPSFALSPDGLQLSHFAARINIKVAFAKNKGLRSRQGLGLPTMLRKSNMQLEGRHHSGIDDCKNILRIAEHLQNRNWKPTTADFER
jgi:ERI1 exoribonuclease 3